MLKNLSIKTIVIIGLLLTVVLFYSNSYAKNEYDVKEECVWSPNYIKLNIDGKIECLIKENITRGYILNPSLVAELGIEGHKLLIKKAYESIKSPKRLYAILALLGPESLPLGYYKKMFQIYHRKEPLPAGEVNTLEEIALYKIFRADVYEIATPESYKEAIEFWTKADQDIRRDIEISFKDSIAGGANIEKIVPFLHAYYANPASKGNTHFILEQLVRAKDPGVIPILIERLKNESWLFDRSMAADWLGQIGKSENINETQKKINMPIVNAISSANDVALIIPTLKEAIKSDQDPRVKISAANALSELGDKSGVKELIPLLKDDDPDIQRISKEALTEITGEHYGDNTKAWGKWLERYKRTHKQQKTMQIKPPTPVVVKSGFKEFKIASVKELYSTIYNQVPTSGAAYYEYHYTDKFIPFLPESFWKDNEQPSDEPIRMGYYLEIKGPEGKGNYVITILKGRKTAMLMLLKEQDKTYSKEWEQKLDACDFYNLLVKDLFDTKTEHKLKAPKDLNIVVSCTINDQAKAMIYKWSNEKGIEPLYFEKEGDNKQLIKTQEVSNKIYGSSRLPQGVEIECADHNCMVICYQGFYIWYEGVFKLIPPEITPKSAEGFTPYTIAGEIQHSKKKGKQDYYVGGKPTFE